MANSKNHKVPIEYQPISMWGYFGYQVLFSIPIIGLVFLIVFALGGTENINLKNFARSYFVIFIIILIVGLILGLTGALEGVSSSLNNV